MNELLNRVANLSALPDAVCRRLHHAREIADAGQPGGPGSFRCDPYRSFAG